MEKVIIFILVTVVAMTVMFYFLERKEKKEFGL